MWTKPQRKPKDISPSDFDSNPNNLVVREVHAYICIPGFRTEEITLVTTLIDALEYPAHEILKLSKAYPLMQEPRHLLLAKMKSF